MQSTREAGKAAFTDIAMGRLSLPVIYAIHLSEPEHLIRNLLTPGGLKPGQLEIVADALFQTQAHVRAYNEGRVMVIEAKKHLQNLPDGEAKAHLIKVSDYLVDRDFHSKPN